MCVLFVATRMTKKVFRPCKSPQHRLKSLGIENKFACIQGMPVVTQEEAEMIADHILVIKGVHSRAWKIAKTNGTLQIPMRKLTCNGIVNIRSLAGIMVDWTNAPRQKDTRMNDKCEKLGTIHCPDCQAHVPLKNLMLRNR